MRRQARAWRQLLVAALCSFALAKKAELLEEAEDALPPQYPKTFPRGVLNPAWANDRELLREMRAALRSGRPVVISDFLAPPVADALAAQLEKLAAAQDDDEDELGYPFQRRTEGPYKGTPKKWAPQKPRPCERILEDFTVTRRSTTPGSLPSGHASAYDQSWSWLRRGDYYGLHADDAQMRYLALTVHLARDWSASGGGDYVWCGPDGTDDLLVESPDRPHFHKTFNVSRNGTTLTPGYNTAVVFPIFRNSYHAVAPVLEKGRGRRFTLQGWYVDPCTNQPPDDGCVAEAMRRLQAWSEKRSQASPSTQPPVRLAASAAAAARYEL